MISYSLPGSGRVVNKYSPDFIFSTASAAFSLMLADILMFLDNIMFPDFKTVLNNAMETEVKPLKNAWIEKSLNFAQQKK